MSRSFTVDGKKMVFNHMAFIDAFYAEQAKREKGVAELEGELADEIHVEKSSVHNWRNYRFGPSSKSLIQELAKKLGIDYHELLTDAAEKGKKATLSDRQMTSAKKIFDVCLWYLSEYDNTDGFRRYYQQEQEAGSENPKAAAVQRVKEMNDRISLVYNQEYFDLKDHPIFMELGDYLSDTLDALVLNCEAEKKNPREISHGYDRAMIGILTIVDKYV